MLCIELACFIVPTPVILSGNSSCSQGIYFSIICVQAFYVILHFFKLSSSHILANITSDSPEPKHPHVWATNVNDIFWGKSSHFWRHFPNGLGCPHDVRSPCSCAETLALFNSKKESCRIDLGWYTFEKNVYCQNKSKLGQVLKS